MGKNIVIFSDGTGQMGGVGSNTNVYKLFNMIEDRTDRQIAYYDPGLGTDWRKITGLLNGREFQKTYSIVTVLFLRIFRPMIKYICLGLAVARLQ